MKSVSHIPGGREILYFTSQKFVEGERDCISHPRRLGRAKESEFHIPEGGGGRERLYFTSQKFAEGDGVCISHSRRLGRERESISHSRRLGRVMESVSHLSLIHI